MVKIRLQRAGKKKAPFYHIVVADSKSPRDGKIIEEIGTYNPMVEPSELKLDNEKVEKYKVILEELKKALNSEAWDGKWYRRAFFENGIPFKVANVIGYVLLLCEETYFI